MIITVSQLFTGNVSVITQQMLLMSTYTVYQYTNTYFCLIIETEINEIIGIQTKDFIAQPRRSPKLNNVF